MNTYSSPIKRYPLVTFFILSYLLSWWTWPLYVVGLSPSPLFGAGPFLAAVIVLATTLGKPGIKDLLRRMVKWQIGLGWYVVGLGLPVVLTLMAARLNVWLGAPAPTAAQLQRWPELVPTFFLLLLIPGIGGAWEEPGWRGYALPRLQAARPALTASLILGLFWAGWHLPLFLIGSIQWPDILLIFAVSIVFTWIYNSTGGSVLIMMLAHAMNNTISGEFFSPMFSGGDAVRQAWLVAILWSVVAIVVVVAANMYAAPVKDAERRPVPGSA